MQLPAHSGISGSFRLIEDELCRVKELIAEQLADVSDKVGVGRLLEQSSICMGKMIRPGLVLLCGKCVGKITEEHIRIAAIVEMIHNATLLHDDVIDEGQHRRGLATVNSLWGNEPAVLLGDFLLSRVLKMCVDLERRVRRIIADTTARICEGELRQIMNSSCAEEDSRYDLSESEYIDIITEKSAVLFSSCCELGGLLSGADENQVQSLAGFGLNLGIAFQITDDLLDIIGDESKTGKTVGCDADKNKLTLAVIHLLRTVDKDRRALCISYIADNDRKKLTEMLRSFGGLEYAGKRSGEFIAEAIGSLADLKESEAKTALTETAKFIERRVIVP